MIVKLTLVFSRSDMLIVFWNNVEMFNTTNITTARVNSCWSLPRPVISFTNALRPRKVRLNIFGSFSLFSFKKHRLISTHWLLFWRNYISKPERDCRYEKKHKNDQIGFLSKGIFWRSISTPLTDPRRIFTCTQEIILSVWEHVSYVNSFRKRYFLLNVPSP